MIDGIRHAGVDGAELLEVGCGLGYLHRALLRSGAARATGVDLSEQMLGIARTEARTSGLDERADYRQGDFVRIAPEVPDADVTVLDKVVCCYPDWRELVDTSLAKTRRVYALTFPRDRASTRFGVYLMRWGLNRGGCCYQPYLHDPQQIESRILSQGFSGSYSAQTTNWFTRVYVRPVY